MVWEPGVAAPSAVVSWALISALRWLCGQGNLETDTLRVSPHDPEGHCLGAWVSEGFISSSLKGK